MDVQRPVTASLLGALDCSVVLSEVKNPVAREEPERAQSHTAHARY